MSVLEGGIDLSGVVDTCQDGDDGICPLGPDCEASGTPACGATVVNESEGAEDVDASTEGVEDFGVPVAPV